MSPARGDRRPVVTYSHAHLRLKWDRGRPDTFACVECGETAREWAYLGSDPNELTDPKKGRVYSLDQRRYAPMCVSCHRRHDRALADGRSPDVCPRGHSWAEEGGVRVKRGPNTGLRFCRACQRENNRRYRATQLEKAVS